MASPIFRCGHAKTEENTKVSPSTKGRCRICHTERLRRWRVANTNSGGVRGRPVEFVSADPIGITDSDVAFREMVKQGTRLLGAAIDRMLGRVA